MYHIDFPTKDALSVIMKRCDNDAARVHEELEKYKSMRRRIRQIDETSCKLEEAHAGKLSELALDRIAVVNECDHVDVEYHPDASGNNDSHHECKVCGKDLGKRYKPAAYDG